MHREREILERRLARVRKEYIRPAIWSRRTPFAIESWSVPNRPDGTVGEPVDPEEAAAQSYEPSGPGSAWGRPWGTTWFRLRGEVPVVWEGLPVDAILNLGFNELAPGFMAEGLVWRHDGDGWAPERGLHPQNHVVRVADPALGGEQITYVIEAAANPLMWGLESAPNSDRDTAGTAPLYFVGDVALAVRDAAVFGLHHDLRTLVGVMNELPLDGARRWELFEAVERSLDALDLDDVSGSAAAARAELVEVMSRPAVPSAHRLSAVGHAHIDTAWLWPLRETERKAARSFSNALRLAEDEPEFVFACSQAAQYEWMRLRYPSVFAGIAKAIDRGQWAPVGGMWVEADGNVTGGESMARQFLHGQRYFREHFGVTCREVWIPDVFGYPAGFPQIFRLGGCDRFLTQKMSWNRTNRFPHHTFWWEGMDGSRVFTHFPPADTYNSMIEPFELAKAERQFAEKGRSNRSMLLFGHGDGGGGPAPDMFERYRRLRDFEGMPRIEIEAPSSFFDAAIDDYPDAPVWVGELYFEMHRGTYTSQARTKQGNRRNERLLREAEIWSTAAFGTRELDGYPATELDRLWKETLVLQFHDILPGSSIGWVHREAEEAYERMAAELEALISRATERLAAGLTLFNAAPHDRDEVLVLDAPALAGTPRTQSLADGRVALRVAVPALGSAAAVAIDIDTPVTVGDRTLDNGLVRVTLGDDGCVHSFIAWGTPEAPGREVIASGARGALPQLHPDLPLEYDAWDIEEYHRHRVTDLDEVDAIEVVEAGPLVGRIRVTRSFRSSTLTQTYVLRAGSSRLDVEIDVDWAERNQLLKLAWPVDVQADDVIRHVQFGHIRTPIHTNTTWDAARFEVCAHQWIDVGEPGFGVALLNDGRYGHDVTRTRGPRGEPTTTMRLTLLKGAIYPDPRADLGQHRVTCAVLPHAGKFRKEGLIAEGYRLNVPIRVADGSAGVGSSPDAGQVVSVDDDAVVVEAVKPAEDGSGDLVIRCYESFGGRATATVQVPWEFWAARLTDFLEDDPPPEPRPHLEVIDAHTIRVSLRPFQIATVRLEGIRRPS
ncbi:MAG TPA: glycoside hydrolase family 38 C-terminal domain-containing protein [Microthrixaceae bacterium]|nr:glycoside hydrolase family 38 C-terminal domain-containing protein [Microthrixaceae bacterium]